MFVSNRDNEKKIISKISSILQITEEKENRKYSSKEVWNIVTGDNVTTQLIDEEETYRVARIYYETMTEEEKLLS